MTQGWMGFVHQVSVPTAGADTCPHRACAEDVLTSETYCLECGVVLTFPPLVIGYVARREWRGRRQIARRPELRDWALSRLRAGASLQRVSREARSRGLALSVQTVYRWAASARVVSRSRRGGKRAPSSGNGLPRVGSGRSLRDRLYAESRAIESALNRMVPRTEAS